MKALIRNEGETVTEDMNIPGIDWTSGYPLTNPKWFGGPYTLIMNYVPEVEKDLDFIRGLHEEVVIGGVRYSKEELRSLIE